MNLKRDTDFIFVALKSSNIGCSTSADISFQMLSAPHFSCEKK